MTRRNAALSALSFEFFLSSQTPKLKYIVGGTIKFYYFFVVFMSFRFSGRWVLLVYNPSFLHVFHDLSLHQSLASFCLCADSTCLCTNHSPPFVFARLLLSLHQSPLLKETRKDFYHDTRLLSPPIFWWEIWTVLTVRTHPRKAVDST